MAALSVEICDGIEIYVEVSVGIGKTSDVSIGLLLLGHHLSLTVSQVCSPCEALAARAAGQGTSDGACDGDPHRGD